MAKVPTDCKKLTNLNKVSFVDTINTEQTYSIPVSSSGPAQSCHDHFINNKLLFVSAVNLPFINMSIDNNLGLNNIVKAR